jgi:hypothetical protein
VINALALNTDPPSTATANTAYAGHSFSATGGEPPYFFNITAGSLPSGMSMNAGMLAGTPTVANTFNFTVTVTDSSNPVKNDSHQFTMVVDPDTSSGNEWLFTLNVPASNFVEYRNENDYDVKSVNLLKSAFTSINNIYIPQTAGGIVTSGSETINWDVKGDILLDTNITHGRNSDALIVSKEGSIVINSNIICTSNPFNNHVLEIKAKKDINISENRIIRSQNGQQGIRIESETGKINAKGAIIDSQKSISTSVIKILAKNSIDISNSVIKSNATNGPTIEIKSTNNNVLANNAEIETLNSSWNIRIQIESFGEININAASIKSTGTNNEPIIFRSNTNASSDFYINNTSISVPAGKQANAYNLTPQGTLKSGSITYD